MYLNKSFEAQFNQTQLHLFVAQAWITDFWHW